MGIFSKQSQQSAYVPPQTGGSSTLLGSSAQPEAGQYDDLNRSPATSVELRFRHATPGQYDTGFDHAFIVITNNQTGEQSVHQASSLGPQGSNLFPLPMGTITATTDPYDAKAHGYNQPYRKIAAFNTDASAESVRKSLDDFGNAFNKKAIPYVLPDVRIPFVPVNRRPIFPTPNSNYYGGAAWQFLTGSVPELPTEIDAPGWGDHRLVEDR
jgi:hypothetical protein